MALSLALRRGKRIGEALVSASVFIRQTRDGKPSDTCLIGMLHTY